MKRERISKYTRRSKNVFTGIEDRKLALNELARMDARDELLDIANNFMKTPEIRRRARELLRAME